MADKTITLQIPLKYSKLHLILSEVAITIGLLGKSLIRGGAAIGGLRQHSLRLMFTAYIHMTPK